MNNQDITLLAAAPLLAGVSAAEVSAFAGAGRHRVLKGRFGRIPAEELSQRLFFVLSGEIKMIQLAPDGQECLMQRVGPGEFFCLSSVISGFSCQSEGVSAGTTQILSWGQDYFRAFMRGNAQIYNNLLAQMASQVTRERELRTLSRCCKADVKVAAYLLHKIRNGHCGSQCGKTVVDLRPINVTAQELGVARETLSRCLQRLVDRRCISYQRGLVKISELNRLEAVLDEDDCQCSCL